MKIGEYPPPTHTPKKSGFPAFLEKLEDLETLLYVHCCNDPQELSNSGLTGHVPLAPSPPSLLPCFCFTYQAHLKTPQRNEASKIPSSLVLNHLPWPAFHSTSQNFPRLGGSEIVTDFLLLGFDSSTWSNTWHNSLRLPVFPACFAPALYTRRPIHIPCCWQPQKRGQRLPSGWLSPYLSLPSSPHSFFQGPPGDWPSNSVSWFPFLKSSLGLNHRIKLLFQLWPVSLKLCLWLVLTKIFS